MSTTTAGDILETLRGQRTNRPTTDLTLAGGLRSWLEDDLSPLTVDLSPSEPMFLSPRGIVAPQLAAVPGLQALARSALVSALLAQRVVLGEVAHPMDDALAALESDPARAELVETIHSLDADGFAHLAAEVAAHHAVLARQLGSIPPTWFPRVNSRLSTALAGGRVVLGAVASLIVGPPAGAVASVCLLDVTTSTLESTTPTRLGVLALIELLRSGAAPLRVGALSTATGEQLVLEVTDQLLVDAVGDVVAAVRARRSAA